MLLNAHLDVDLVAVETDDQINVMLEPTAPEADRARNGRPPNTLQVVLDRSGSMAGDRLEAAKDSLALLVGRLDPRDNFGLVTFDNDVQVPVPAGPLTDKSRVVEMIRSIPSGGSTNLSGGLLRGIQEARRIKGDRGATQLLVSDGHANQGVTDPDALGKVAADARERGVTTSTIGIGLGYDEKLMADVATGGAGRHALRRRKRKTSPARSCRPRSTVCSIRSPRRRASRSSRPIRSSASGSSTTCRRAGPRRVRRRARRLLLDRAAQAAVGDRGARDDWPRRGDRLRARAPLGRHQDARHPCGDDPGERERGPRRRRRWPGSRRHRPHRARSSVRRRPSATPPTQSIAATPSAARR